MKKEILVFIFDGYADWESSYICSELNSPEVDYIIKTISLDKEPKVSMGGFRIIPDYSVVDYPKNFAMLLLNGGNAWSEQKNNAIKPDFFSEMDEEVKKGVYKKYVEKDENGEIGVCTKKAWEKVWAEQKSGYIHRTFTADFESTIPSEYTKDGKAHCYLYSSIY